MSMTETLNAAILNNPSLLWNDLGLPGYIQYDRISIPCPIHNGDNPAGVTVYFNEYNGIRGCFRCNTRGCERTFKKSLIGFVRGILSSRHCRWSRPGDEIYLWNATLDYLKGLYGIDNVKNSNTSKDKNSFISFCTQDERETKILCSLDRYLKAYTQESEYFLKRGFSREVLNKYYVRHCNIDSSKFFGRTFVPVVDDESRNVLGVSARTTHNQTPKWRYNKGFPSATTLYGLNYANESIRRSRTAIICEGPANIWRLNEAGIYNCVAIWSASGWNDYKRYLLDKLGVMRLVVALDNDDAGRENLPIIQRDAGRFYNVIEAIVPDPYNDVADMSPQIAKEFFDERR